jgi:hypothetical protein
MVYHTFGFVAIWQTLLLPSGVSDNPGRRSQSCHDGKTSAFEICTR